MKNSLTQIIFLMGVALILAFTAKYISFNIPYVHVVLFPYNNVWIVSGIFFTVLINLKFTSKYNFKKIFDAIFIIILVAWILSIVFWIFI